MEYSTKRFLLATPILLLLLFSLQTASAQVVLDADGPGNTYSLITSVLAPGQNPIETPDCGHAAFGDHIDEVFDATLNDYVFRFHIHNTPDNDRCQKFDRQRNEIKSYSPSPANLKGVAGETVVYKWKFKLDAGFQSSSSFTHLHQLKSVGGSQESMPMYTFTTRKGNPDQLELRYAETTSQVTLKKTAIAPFIDTWVEATEVITYGTNGTYSVELKRVSDNAVLFSYENQSIINWRVGATFVRPKWGIYRSLNNVQDLRDEIVRYANFSVEEIDLNAPNVVLSADCIEVFPSPLISDQIIVGGNFTDFDIRVLNGFNFEVLNYSNSPSPITIDMNSLGAGTFFLSIKHNNSDVELYDRIKQ